MTNFCQAMSDNTLHYIQTPMLIVDSEWRASIVKWSYNVVDYFDLSREVVALSMSLFDRFFATRICSPTSNLALLVSIATLHVAIKVRESAIIKLSTLSWFGRGKFSESRIAQTELLVLTNIRWLANPPTVIAFVMHLLLLLPDMSLVSKREIFESSRFLAELSVADSFFIAKLSSVTGLAAIINSLDECNIPTMSPAIRADYLNCVSGAIGISHHNSQILAAQRRLRLLSKANGG
eukprot:CAMPEP_0172316580 /NCGR_PEP_ID=MMETSP1058-20130122/28739_1 /TAXON_ID=83371 /ORGANISM="Detonula confervacea, Strain CCMP 353" /LENGTH=235 /DNA_ID=CAMNT_0013030921 /DNA_START=127 /DNA_END=833 /DNA_ORIENTATION=-